MGTSRFLTAAIFVVVMMVVILRCTEEKEENRYKKREKQKNTFVHDPDGSRTELMVREKLRALFGFRPAISVLLPAGEMTTELDLAQATTKGIFVVECKARSQMVSGDVKDDYWLIGTKGNLTMENPIKQNYYHVKAVQRYLGQKVDELPIFNIVVLNCSDIRVTGLNTLSKTMLFRDMTSLDSLKRLPDVISKEKAEELQKLLYDKEGTLNQLKEHIENVKNKNER